MPSIFRKFSNSARLGDLLVQAGILTPGQLQEVVRNSRSKKLQMGQVLVMSGLLTQKDLQIVLEAQSMLRDRMIDLNMAVQCIKVARKLGSNFSDALEDYDQAAAQRARTGKLGELFIEAGIISQEDLSEAMERSVNTGMPLGRMLVLNKVINAEVLQKGLDVQLRLRDEVVSREEALIELRRIAGLSEELEPNKQPEEKKQPVVRLGELLVMAGILNETDVMDALEWGLANQQPIGNVLVSQELISKELLDAALFFQTAVREGKIDAMKACECLSEVFSTGVTMEEALADAVPTKPPVAPKEAPISYEQLITSARVVSEEDIDKAFDRENHTAAFIGKVLVLCGALDVPTLQSTLRCYQMIAKGYLSADDAIAALDYCLHHDPGAPISFEQALRDLQWTPETGLRLRGERATASGTDIAALVDQTAETSAEPASKPIADKAARPAANADEKSEAEEAEATAAAAKPEPQPEPAAPDKEETAKSEKQAEKAEPTAGSEAESPDEKDDEAIAEPEPEKPAAIKRGAGGLFDDDDTDDFEKDEETESSETTAELATAESARAEARDAAAAIKKELEKAGDAESESEKEPVEAKAFSLKELVSGLEPGAEVQSPSSKNKTKAEAAPEPAESAKAPAEKGGGNAEKIEGKQAAEVEGKDDENLAAALRSLYDDSGFSPESQAKPKDNGSKAEGAAAEPGAEENSAGGLKKLLKGLIATPKESGENAEPPKDKVASAATKAEPPKEAAEQAPQQPAAKKTEPPESKKKEIEEIENIAGMSAEDLLVEIMKTASNPELSTKRAGRFSETILPEDAKARQLAKLLGKESSKELAEKLSFEKQDEDADALDTAFGRLAETYFEQGNYKEAQVIYERMLVHRLNELGPENPLLVEDYNNLAMTLCVQGRFDKAEPFMKRAVFLYEQGDTANAVEHADYLHSLGTIEYKLEKYKEAEELMLRVVQLRRENLPEDHEDMGRALGDYAKVLKKMGKTETAETIYKKAREILAKQNQ